MEKLISKIVSNRVLFWIVWTPILLIINFLMFGCAGMNVSIQGVDINKIKTMSTPKAIVGALASIAVHEAGHIVTRTVIQEDYKFDGVKLNGLGVQVGYVGEASDNENLWAARGGFIVQNIVGLLLTVPEYTRESDFMKGYTAMSSLELLTYPLRNSSSEGNDLHNIDLYGGNKGIEWILHSSLSLYSFSRSWGVLTFNEKE